MNILYCWEFGGGLGHLVNAKAVSQIFMEQGASVSVAACHYDETSAFFSGSVVPVFSAPKFLPLKRRREPPKSYVDIFRQRGWESENELTKLVDGWLSLFHRLQPDVIFFDYAPTALLAARGLNIARYIIGSGFGSMTPGKPLQRFYHQLSLEYIEKQENETVAVINKVCYLREVPGVRYISDLYTADDIFLTNFKELDLEPERPKAIYIGPLGNRPQRTCMDFSDGAKPPPEVFAYLKPKYSGLKAVLAALAAIHASVFVFCPALPKTLRKQFEHRIRFSDKPCDLDEVLKSSKVVICHGGPGTLCQSLRVGVPMLVAPLQLEQSQYAEIIQGRGLGLRIPSGASVDIIVAMIEELIRNPKYQQEARRMKQKYEDWHPEHILKNITGKIIQNYHAKKEAMTLIEK